MPRDTNARLVYSTGDEPRPSPQPEHHRPAAKPHAGVRIRLERRASGRLATVVTGLPVAKEAVAELVRSLKTACGAGGTFRNGSFELQGDHRDAVEAALRERGLSSKRAGG